MSELLKIDDLSIFFVSPERRTSAVSSLSFAIEEGEVFGLAGESGCGKSLTALSILRILPPNAVAEGEISFKGKNLLALKEAEMRGIRGRDISMVFQEPMTSLNPVLTVGYQIGETLTTHYGIPKREAMDKSVELLKAVRIPSPELRIKDYPHQMSGGMRQRVMIAMAIACNPSLLIADEPTTALDVTIQAQILDLVQGLRRERGMSVLLITHDLGIISEQADRVAIMYAGRIVELADTQTIFDNPMHPYTRGLLESLPVAKGKALKPINGVVPSPGHLPPGCKFSDRCGLAIAACSEREPELIRVSEKQTVRCIVTTKKS